MQHAHFRAAIASWWGQSSFEDQHIPALLSATAESGVSSVCWALYYEPAVTGGGAQIRSDLAYIANRYAGFWKYNESSPRLARDLGRWATNVADMVTSREPWQLVTTFNEWGEGTSVEDANDWHDTASGQSQYLDALHNSG